MSPCPKCGCNVAQLVGAGMRRNEPWALYQCDHCAHRYYEGRGGLRVGESKFVMERPVRCPRCGSADTKVEGSRLRGNVRVRSRKCRNCRFPFESGLLVGAGEDET